MQATVLTAVPDDVHEYVLPPLPPVTVQTTEFGAQPGPPDVEIVVDPPIVSTGRATTLYVKELEVQ